ncbi:helix-turn-helix transcriptional regulator [uncultured Eubacterium sp.]|uniref:helix-turn-helix domain-containing protein n=1 Tax=uncultured Eubacterium sp. TaxID=165185 RepID=UPI002594BDB1|nr:helix-turn-helix transcriptional regulator [uncultured Eubacterium sp.]
MIVYYKLANILKERNMQWKDLCKAGISINMPTKFSLNRSMNTENINKVCAYLGVQPGDIMEYVDEKDDEKAKIQAQITQLQKQLKEIE